MRETIVVQAGARQVTDVLLQVYIDMIPFPATGLGFAFVTFAHIRCFHKLVKEILSAAALVVKSVRDFLPVFSFWPELDNLYAKGTMCPSLSP
jgi:hypothetical protein